MVKLSFSLTAACAPAFERKTLTLSRAMAKIRNRVKSLSYISEKGKAFIEMPCIDGDIEVKAIYWNEETMMVYRREVLHPTSGKTTKQSFQRRMPSFIIDCGEYGLYRTSSFGKVSKVGIIPPKFVELP